MAELYYGKGTAMGGGFDVGAPSPIDNRIIIQSKEEFESIPINRLYIGMQIFIVNESKFYFLKEIKGPWANTCEWVEIANGEGAVIKWQELDENK